MIDYEVRRAENEKGLQPTKAPSASKSLKTNSLFDPKAVRRQSRMSKNLSRRNLPCLSRRSNLPKHKHRWSLKDSAISGSSFCDDASDGVILTQCKFQGVGLCPSRHKWWLFWVLMKLPASVTGWKWWILLWMENNENTRGRRQCVDHGMRESLTVLSVWISRSCRRTFDTQWIST